MLKDDRKYQWLEVHKIFWTFVIIYFFPWLVILVSPRYGVIDWLQLQLILGSIAGIFLGYGAISSDRAYRRLDFVLALPYPKESVFWRKFVFRASLLAILLFGSTLTMAVGEVFNREPLPSIGMFLAFLLIVTIWNFGLFGISFCLSSVSSSPVNEAVRAIGYSMPVQLGFLYKYDEYYWNAKSLMGNLSIYPPELVALISASIYALAILIGFGMVSWWAYRKYRMEEVS